MAPNEKAKRPNCFMAIQIRNPEIHKNIVECQDKALLKHKLLEPHVESVQKAHITLCIANIEWHEIEETKTVLTETVEAKLKDLHGTKIQFTGINTFNGGKVVWVKPSSGETELQKISKILKESLLAAGLNVLEIERPFTPHLTIFKYDYEAARKSGRDGKTAMKSSHLHFQEYQDFEFGSESLTSVQFCCMETPKGEDGYYHRLHEVFFNKEMDG